MILGWWRRRKLRKLKWFQEIEGKDILVPTDTPGLSYVRRKVTFKGWQGLAQPEFDCIQTSGVVDIGHASKKVVDDIVHALKTEADRASSDVLRDMTQRIRFQSTRAHKLVHEQMQELVVGTIDKAPSVLVETGREAAVDLYTTLGRVVSASTQKVCADIIRRSIMQVLMFAREEAAHGGSKAGAFLIPENTRFYFLGNTRDVYIIEEKPAVRTVLWDGKAVRLSFPYVVFAVAIKAGRLETLSCFFRNTALKDLDDELGIPPIPDLMDHCKMCFPGTSVRGPASTVVAAAIHAFWGSNFLSSHYSGYASNAMRKTTGFSWQVWREISTSEPLKILSYPWVPAKHKIKSFEGEAVEGFDPQKSMHALDLYGVEIAKRIAQATQEAVVEILADSQNAGLARKVFDNRIHDAIAKTAVAETAREAVLHTLSAICEPDKTTTLVNAVATKAAARFEEYLATLPREILQAIHVAIEPHGRRASMSGTTTLEDILK
ncbi:MAG: hypothetical protein AAB421_05410 [Patescibacteria group bacterium]